MSEEISLSIEETNALRAKLGLKPLELVSETAANKTELEPLPISPKNKTVKKGDHDAEKEDGKRLVSEIMSGGGVLDVFEDLGPTSDWLSQHKKKLKVDSATNDVHDDSESSSDDDEGSEDEDDDDSSAS